MPKPQIAKHVGANIAVPMRKALGVGGWVLRTRDLTKLGRSLDFNDLGAAS